MNKVEITYTFYDLEFKNLQELWNLLLNIFDKKGIKLKECTKITIEPFKLTINTIKHG